jgi:hypothetical protein
VRFYRPEPGEQHHAARPVNHVQGVMIEKELARYIHLSCGDYTTRETAERESLWRPKKGLYFCEAHNKWVPVYVPPKPPPLKNDELPF